MFKNYSKYVIIVAVTIVLLLTAVIVADNYKREIPTDAEWKAYLAYEKELNGARDTYLAEQCTYMILDQDTNSIVLYGTLADCKEFLKDKSDNLVLMPFNPIYQLEE